jgi:biotin operon repressor
MSFRALAWAWEKTTGSAPSKLVLMALASCHNDETGRCYPSIQYIADKSECSRRTVERALSDLEEQGLIERVHRSTAEGRKTSNEYRLGCDGMRQSDAGYASDCRIGMRQIDAGYASESRINLESNLELKTEESARAREAAPLVLEQHVGFSRFAPADWSPNPAIERMVTVQPGVDREQELVQFRLHEFVNGKTDWDRAWAKWLVSARPRGNAQETRSITTRHEDSTHPAIAAERRSQEEDDALYQRIGYRNRSDYEKGIRM